MQFNDPPPPPIQKSSCVRTVRWFQKVVYLNDTHARVKEDGSFGFLGGVLILVEVEVVGSISQLGQTEVPPLEGLEDENIEC